MPRLEATTRTGENGGGLEEGGEETKGSIRMSEETGQAKRGPVRQKTKTTTKTGVIASTKGMVRYQ